MLMDTLLSGRQKKFGKPEGKGRRPRGEKEADNFKGFPSVATKNRIDNIDLIFIKNRIVPIFRCVLAAL